MQIFCDLFSDLLFYLTGEVTDFCYISHNKGFKGSQK